VWVGKTGQPSGSIIDPLSVKNQRMIIRHMSEPSLNGR
jgi:hypothetical protein